MEGEYVPPSLRKQNNNEIIIEKRILEEIPKKVGLIGLEEEGDVYIPTVLIKEKEINLEKDFPVLGMNKNTNEVKSVWGNVENLQKIKEDISGVQIKSERVIDIRPEKKLKAVYYDEDMEEIVEKKIESSRLKRDMDLGIVYYSQEERIYVYKEKDEKARIAFYDPEGFDILLEEENNYEEEEYSDIEEDY